MGPVLLDQPLDETQPGHRTGEAFEPRPAARKPDCNAEVTRAGRQLGSVLVRGTPAEVTSHPEVISSYLGGDLDVIQRSGALSG